MNTVLAGTPEEPLPSKALIKGDGDKSNVAEQAVEAPVRTTEAPAPTREEPAPTSENPKPKPKPKPPSAPPTTVVTPDDDGGDDKPDPCTGANPPVTCPPVVTAPENP
jgi:hypothetical protein